MEEGRGIKTTQEIFFVELEAMEISLVMTLLKVILETPLRKIN